jgi:hypothetical protein
MTSFLLKNYKSLQNPGLVLHGNPFYFSKVHSFFIPEFVKWFFGRCCAWESYVESYAGRATLGELRWESCAGRATLGELRWERCAGRAALGELRWESYAGRASLVRAVPAGVSLMLV